MPVRLAGFSLDFPAMPRADDLGAVDEALTEWASAMRTDVIQRAVFAIDVSDADQPIGDIEFLCLAGLGQLLHSCDF